MTKRAKNIWRIVKLLAFTSAIIWVITLGGVNAGKTIGVLIVMAAAIPFALYVYARQIRSKRKLTWRKAAGASLKEIFVIWFK